jgi:uncharacterized protein YjbI with pentapeptide repeats
MADDPMLTTALDAFDIYLVGETADGRKIMSRDGRTPIDDTVVFMEGAPDEEMTVVDAEMKVGPIVWFMEPEVAPMAAVAAATTVPYESDFAILGRAKQEAAQAGQAPAAPETPMVEMPAAEAPEAPMTPEMPVEQAAAEDAPDMTEPSPEDMDAAQAEAEATDATGAPDGEVTAPADFEQLGQMLEEAEKRVDQLEGLVATMVLGTVTDETFETSKPEQVVEEAKVGSVIQIAYEFGDVSGFLARVAAVGDTDLNPDMEDRLNKLIDRLDKLEQTIGDMMEAEMEDEQMVEDDTVPESEQTVIDETAPKPSEGTDPKAPTAPDDKGAKTAGFFQNRRGVRVWHDPSTGKFAPAGFVSPKVLARLWRGDSKAGAELDSLVRKARKDNPALDLDGIIGRVLGPRPSDPTKKLHYDAGSRRVNRFWAATKPKSYGFEPWETDAIPSPREVNFAMTTPNRPGERFVPPDDLSALRGADLSGRDLADVDLAGYDLANADLSGANLSGADLDGANLSEADFEGANLSLANLSGANLSLANLSEADLTNARLRDAILSGANLSDAQLLRSNLEGADLSGANLTNANLGGSRLNGASFRDANLRGAGLIDTYRNRADFSGADLTDVITGDSYGNPVRSTDREIDSLSVPEPIADLIDRIRAVTGPTKGSPYRALPMQPGELVNEPGMMPQWEADALDLQERVGRMSTDEIQEMIANGGGDGLDPLLIAILQKELDARMAI